MLNQSDRLNTHLSGRKSVVQSLQSKFWKRPFEQPSLPSFDCSLDFSGGIVTVRVPVEGHGLPKMMSVIAVRQRVMSHVEGQTHDLSGGVVLKKETVPLTVTRSHPEEKSGHTNVGLSLSPLPDSRPVSSTPQWVSTHGVNVVTIVS